MKDLGVFLMSVGVGILNLPFESMALKQKKKWIRAPPGMTFALTIAK
jgi:hypothetical protein